MFLRENVGDEEYFLFAFHGQLFDVFNPSKSVVQENFQEPWIGNASCLTPHQAHKRQPEVLLLVICRCWDFAPINLIPAPRAKSNSLFSSWCNEDLLSFTSSQQVMAISFAYRGFTGQFGETMWLSSSLTARISRIGPRIGESDPVERLSWQLDSRVELVNTHPLLSFIITPGWNHWHHSPIICWELHMKPDQKLWAIENNI